MDNQKHEVGSFWSKKKSKQPWSFLDNGKARGWQPWHPANYTIHPEKNRNKQRGWVRSSLAHLDFSKPEMPLLTSNYMFKYTNLTFLWEASCANLQPQDPYIIDHRKARKLPPLPPVSSFWLASCQTFPIAANKPRRASLSWWFRDS